MFGPSGSPVVEAEVVEVFRRNRQPLPVPEWECHVVCDDGSRSSCRWVDDGWAWDPVTTLMGGLNVVSIPYPTFAPPSDDGARKRLAPASTTASLPSPCPECGFKYCECWDETDVPPVVDE